MHPGPEHPSIIGGKRQRRKPRRGRVALLLILASCVVLPLLPRFLATTGDPPSSAQAIYVFPGQVPERAECGAALYREAVAPVAVFTGGQVASELEAIGRPLDDASLNALIARRHGVPEEAEIVLPWGSSTWEDALVLGQWMRESGVRRVLAVTSPTHSRRALYTLRLSLGPLGDGIDVYRCGTIYGPLWWTRERSLVRITLETLKLGFYGVRYFLPALLGLDPGPEPPGTAP